MMNPLSHYIHRYKPSKRKMWNIINHADRAGLMSIEPCSKAHFILRMIQEYGFSREMTKNMCLIDYQINLEMIMTNLHNKKNPLNYFQEEIAGVVHLEKNNYIYKDTFLLEEIQSAFREKKYIFIVFSFDDYDVDNIKGINEYCGHSTCALLTPNKHTYDCYYINPHGRDGCITNYYKKIISNKRCRVYYYKKALDIVFMEGLVRSFNSISKTKIKYNSSYRYNYKGANLQSGDSYGTCFVFPYIIFHYIGKYLTRSRYLVIKDKTIYIKSGISQLKKGRLGFFVESIFADFSKKYQEILYGEKFTYKTKREHIETFVIKNAGNFLKSMTGPMVSFMLQVKIKNIMYY